MSFQFLHYDVFTDEPLTGNQLAVFLDAEGLSTDRMQAIAREMNFSETTFVLPSERDDTDVRMRIFTPGTELPMAGHPTIGSTFAMAYAGMIEPESSQLVFGLGIGPTPVDLEWEGSELSFAWMTQPLPAFGEPIADRAGAAATLGLTPADIVDALPVQQVSCGVPYLLLPLNDREAVDRAETDLAAYRAFVRAQRLPADTCLYLFSVTTPDDPIAYARMFAPGFGIPEDPATGSAAGPLGCYLVKHKLVSGRAARRIVTLQGVAMGRPSRIHMSIGERDGQIVDVKVGGEAVLVAKGTLFPE